MTLKACGLPVRTLRAAHERGELKLYRVGRADYVSQVELDAWVRSQPEAERAPKNQVRSTLDPFEQLLASGEVESKSKGAAR